jgi:hypothetical protein
VVRKVEAAICGGLWHPAEERKEGGPKRSQLSLESCGQGCVQKGPALDVFSLDAVSSKALLEKKKYGNVK